MPQKSYSPQLSKMRADLSSEGWGAVPLDRDLYPSFMAELGELIPQYDGRLDYDIRFDADIGGARYSKSTDCMGVHTELPVQDHPPRYVGLYCVQPARCGGGRTALSDGHALLDALPPRLQTMATDLPVPWRVTRVQNGQRDEQGGVATLVKAYPISSPSANGPVLRFSHNYLFYGDANPATGEEDRAFEEGTDLAELATAVVEWFEANKHSHILDPGTVLVFDNHRMLHSREAFTDMGRHLVRYWVS